MKSAKHAKVIIRFMREREREIPANVYVNVLFFFKDKI